jgi:hypothetical protein
MLKGGEGAGKGRGSEYSARSFAFRAARLVPLDFVDGRASGGADLKKENIKTDESNQRLFEERELPKPNLTNFADRRARITWPH